MAAAATTAAVVLGGRTTAWRARGSTSMPRARATRDISGPTTATATGGVNGEIGTTPHSGAAFVTPHLLYRSFVAAKSVDWFPPCANPQSLKNGAPRSRTISKGKKAAASGHHAWPRAETDVVTKYIRGRIIAQVHEQQRR